MINLALTAAHFSRMNRTNGDSALIRPKTARRERLWMEAVDLHYFSPLEIAEAANLSVRRIQAGIKRAREMKLDLPTIWDIEWRTTPNAFTQATQCEQHEFGDIPKGLAIGCLACLRTGLDHLIRKPTKQERAEGDQPRKAPPEPAKPFAERKFGGRKKGKSDK